MSGGLCGLGGSRVCCGAVKYDESGHRVMSERVSRTTVFVVLAADGSVLEVWAGFPEARASARAQGLRSELRVMLSSDPLLDMIGRPGCSSC